MDFKTAMEHYKDGTASSEERCHVEEELEKSQLIAEYLDCQWQCAEIMEYSPRTELKKVRKRLWLRNTAIVLTSLVLVFTILFSAVQYAIPALEKQYWDPSQKTYNDVFNDLAITLGVYSELFCPDQFVTDVIVRKTDFASYTLSIKMEDTMLFSDRQYLTASVDKGKLTLPEGIWDMPGRIFMNTDGEIPETPENIVQEYNDYVCGIIDSFPDYMEVFAAVSFPQDLSMKELIELEETYIQTCRFGWVAIRVSDYERKVLPLCGMKPSTPKIGNWDTVNECYPYFQVNTARWSSATPEKEYEEHFKALLQFSLDQANAGTGLTPTSYHIGGNYYEKALEYVEEYGVYTYGAYVYATPDTLLEMMEDGIISEIDYIDSWIDFNPNLH